jgi:HD-GYP domain-containing protein (c-di-GMP phosphodiesterase class II)
MSEFCDKVDSEGLLIRLLDKELKEDEEEEILAHLRSCPDCLGKMAQVLITNDHLKEAFLDNAASNQPAVEEIDEPQQEKESPRKDARKRKKKSSIEKGCLDLQGSINIDDLPIGMALEYNLYDNKGRLLVASNTPLTRALINNIRRRGITEVAVTPSREAVVSGFIREARAFKGIPDREFYTALTKGAAPMNVSVVTRQMAVDSLKRAFANIGPDTSIDIDEIRDTCEDVIDDLTGDETIGPSLIDMYLVDSSLYHHSINVMLLFATICRNMNLPLRSTRVYAAGAMLHDIGRVFLRKLARVNTHRQIDIDKLHAEAAFKYLTGLGGLDDEVLSAIRNHHERFDGTGFPRGISGKELDDYTQLFILINYYDNLTWDSSREIKMGFHQAANRIIQQCGKLVDTYVVNAFLNVFGHHPPGSWVKLSSGEAGLVVQATPFKPRHPFVHLYYDKNGERLAEAIPLNLSHPDMPHITGHLEPSLDR